MNHGQIHWIKQSTQSTVSKNPINTVIESMDHGMNTNIIRYISLLPIEWQRYNYTNMRNTLDHERESSEKDKDSNNDNDARQL